VSRDANLEAIKRAYRFFCKKYHPDLASQEQQNNFLLVQEAYETLSDTEKRKIYDRGLDQAAGHVPVNREQTGFREEAHPWQERSPGRSQWPDNFFTGFAMEFMANSFGDDFSGLFRDDISHAFANFSADREADVELILSPQEAREGGDFYLDMPITEACPACAGRSYLQRFGCPYCLGTGNRRSRRAFTLHVPPHIKSGTILKLELEPDESVANNTCLIVEVVVSSNSCQRC
jgi:molecular chaperone DnaJ